MTPHPITVYRHRTWHPTPSQYTDTEHDTPTHHSIQTQDMTSHLITVYRHRTWHPYPSQYTDTGHDTPTHHSIQTQDMTSHLITVYRYRTWHPTPSQYRHRTWHPTPSQYTDKGHDIPPCHNIQTQDMTSHPVTVYRHGADLSLCYPLMWITHAKYTTTHFNVLGETQSGNPSPTFHTHQQSLNLMLLCWWSVGSSVASTVPTGSWTRDLWCANPLCFLLAQYRTNQVLNPGPVVCESIMLFARPQLLPFKVYSLVSNYRMQTRCTSWWRYSHQKINSQNKRCRITNWSYNILLKYGQAMMES